MTPACIYCGGDAGEYDEHEECVELSLERAGEAMRPACPYCAPDEACSECLEAREAQDVTRA